MEEKMKIAMLGHKAVPSHRGGIENVLTSLCPLLVERGCQVTCYNRSSDRVEKIYEKDLKKGSYKGVLLKRAPSLPLRGISALIASYTGAIRAAFSDCDVVHFHAEGPCGAMWIPALFGKKLVAMVHGLDWQREKWGKGFASKYIKFGEKMLVRRAHRVIVLSESAREYFRAQYARETELIHNGISRPVSREADLIKSRFGLEKDGYIAIVARLTAEKGVHYLIDAYCRTVTNKKLVIVGDTGDSAHSDPYVESLKEKAAHNPNIIFTGFASGELLDELYSNAYLIALPSDLEGMSMSLLEALAYRNALLCSDIPENLAVAADRAVYFEKGNVAHLAEKLQELCLDPDRVEKLREGTDDYILQKYSWEDVAEKTVALYREILEEKGDRV
jgi:glycosyltransferase involved in cell wall biosynthesis